ncbi:phosphatidylserine/phosphatidylglycerophosphate/cardiolipin synthase family protein [Novosphingobium sp.]|uniref:phospholipase D-like domain-containing protein n=1 Tax=Novosphingobium sp. TaxID=1874826 RepID=UPI0025E06A1A|nr:phosphatidylserine/phosphatidylglycerophosphate/cardiolipin synthase family protein [Novosphingobium sp.]
MSEPKLELLVGAAAFWDRAKADMAAASRRVLVQAMTFEADAAGRSVADAVLAASAADRRVLVDDYTRNVINDTMLPLPFRPAAVKQEAADTLAMFGDMAAQGVGVRITNPVLGHPLRYPLRNHKKLLVLDDAAYIGGINFSDHNFAWHDLMLRIQSPAMADWLAADFAADWAGRPMAAKAAFGPIELISFDGDGARNAALFEPLLDLVRGAKRSVDMISAYPTMPFVAAFAQAARAGARATIYTSAASNKPVVRDYLIGVAGTAGVELRLTPDMTHAKALLIDGETLLLGSSNFNFASYRTSSDYVAVLRDPALIAAFERELLGPARENAMAAAELKIPAWRKLRGRLALEFADAALARLRHGPVRVIDWPVSE